MSGTIRIATPSTLALLLLLGPGACTDTGVPVSPVEAGPDPVTARGSMHPTSADANRDLAALRRATAHLHRFEEAAEGGWDLQVTECKEHPPLGGMGYHYGNLDLYLDGEANVLEPEILLYEPQPSGTLRLVAVEYAVPYFAWQGDPDVDDPPRLFGRDMKRVDDQGEWQLHVWAWKDNPSGIFEDWNPAVDCEHAS